MTGEQPPPGAAGGSAAAESPAECGGRAAALEWAGHHLLRAAAPPPAPTPQPRHSPPSLGPGAAGRGAGVMPSNARVTGSQAQPSPDPAQLRPPPPRNQAPASLCQAARTRPRPPSVTGLSSYNVIGVFDTLRHPRGRDTLQVSCIENIFGWWAGYQNVFVAWRCVTVRRRRLREAPHRAAARRGGDT